MGNKQGKDKSQGASATVGGDKKQLLEAKQKQGAKELKLNYQIDNNTKNLGSGTFGKVFLTFNKHNPDH